MTFGLLSPENALDHATLVLLLIEYLDCPVSVGLAAVDRATLFDIGYNPISNSIWQLS